MYSRASIKCKLFIDKFTEIIERGKLYDMFYYQTDYEVLLNETYMLVLMINLFARQVTNATYATVKQLFPCE
jgi:hypothetical protein